jgi:hypothetical protein
VLWFSVWFVLVVGALVGGFFLLRHLYRSGTALLAALEELSEVVERLDRRVEELAASVGTTPAPVELEDPGPARERLAAVRSAGWARRARRAERHEAAYRRWWAFVR